jgi:phage terminase Nu1 subunit (DNA packaging protein)
LVLFPALETRNMKLTEDIKPVTYMKTRRDASLLLQLTAQGEADVQAGRTMPQDEVFARARRRLAREK